MVRDIEVFKLQRNPYRKASPVRPFHAISFRIYGKAVYEVGEGTITTQNGDILFVPAYTQYTKDTQAELFYVIHFKCDEPLGNKLRSLTPSNSEAMRKLFEKLYRAQTEKDTAFEYECKHLFYKIVLEIEREFRQEANSCAETEIIKAIRLIHESYMNPDFTVGSLAKALNISETYFRKQFQKSRGISPKRYISDLRLQMATELLQSGYYTISEVADRCGFSSNYYFSAFFKKETGKSPREFLVSNH